MRTISSAQDAHIYLLHDKAVVLFINESSKKSEIAEDMVSTLEREYPLILFFKTSNRTALNTNISSSPTILFYENGKEVGRVLGIRHLHKFREMLNLWIVKI